MIPARRPLQRRTPRGPARVFAIPAAIFAASGAGLVLGLTGDGLRDAAAWLFLSLPLLALGAAWRRRGLPSRYRKT
ncbi:hypothetical protein V5F89_09420 [Pelagerythrobacter marensis]|uniref:DUF4175 domain-containing protein n=1 Tax=Pelagerythrobacter marensis TaxID=543877 RepID=A0ABZ2D6M7_9SPHN